MLARDLVLFLIVAVFSLRWIPVAAAAGPSSIVVWIGAGTLLFVPLIVCVLELARRYPEEGGLYAWVKRAFGDYPAFITGWTYWSSNLPFFPAVLYFAAGNALFLIPGGDALVDNRAYFMGAAILGLVIAVLPNLLGMSVGKWLQNIGAFGVWIPAAILVILGGLAFATRGSATPLTARAFVPELSLGSALAWSAIAFGFGGVETASLVASQVREARRTVPIAVVVAGVVITALYILGTLALLMALPVAEISRLTGIVQATERTAATIGAPNISVPVALLVTIGALGGVGAWLTATARLPYVAGIDRYLPARFGTLHPRFGTPMFAMITQAGIAAVLIVLGQAGTSVRGAYDVLVAMSVIAYFIPFMLMFAAAFRLAREEHSDRTLSPTVMRLAAITGFATIAVATALAFVPAESDPNKPLAIAKTAGLTVLLLVVGTALYARGSRRMARQSVASRTRSE